jgi:hypothetical protein
MARGEERAGAPPDLAEQFSASWRRRRRNEARVKNWQKLLTATLLLAYNRKANVAIARPLNVN